MNDSHDSQLIDQEIQRLQALKHECLRQEERARCLEIFGALPANGKYHEEAFAMVARIYVLRAYKHPDRGDKPDHEWIRLWHKYAPEATIDDLWMDAQDYIAGGCGIAG